MTSLRGFWIVALLGLTGCIGGPEPMAPAAALHEASQAIDAILTDEAQAAAGPLEPAEATDSPNQITFWYYEHPLLSRAFSPLRGEDAFSRSHPGVTLHAQFIGDWDVAVQKLTVAMAAGELPDVALVKRGMLARLIPSGRLTPLDTFLPPSLLADLRGPSRDAFTVDGRLYALPADGFCSVLLYNGSLISKAPTNWAELRETAQQLAPKLGSNRFPIGHMPFLPNLWSTGGHIFDGDTTLATQTLIAPTSRLDDPAAHKALQFLMSLKAERLTHPRLLRDEGTALRVFQASDAAMTVSSSAALAQEQAFPVGIAPIPGEKGPISLLSDDALVVFRRYSDARHAALVEFLDFLTGPELQGAEAAKRGSVPVRTSVAAQVRVPEGLAAAYDVAKSTPLHPAWSQIEGTLNRYVELAYAWENSE